MDTPSFSKKKKDWVNHDKYCIYGTSNEKKNVQQVEQVHICVVSLAYFRLSPHVGHTHK